MATPCDEEKFYALRPGQLPTQKWQIVTVATGRQIGSPPVKICSKMDPQLCITIAPTLGPTGWGKYVRLMPCTPDNSYQLWRSFIDRHSAMLVKWSAATRCLAYTFRVISEKEN